MRSAVIFLALVFAAAIPAAAQKPSFDASVDKN